MNMTVGFYMFLKTVTCTRITYMYNTHAC